MKQKAKNLKIGQRVKFDDEKYCFTVRAVRHPFVICTLNLFGELYYTILDVENNYRGSSDSDSFSYASDECIALAMCALHGEHPLKIQNAISQRNRIEIQIRDVVDPVKH
ncbi:hypothetical protein [Acinetobacter venetianus]|uniref:hypothetical protein n=1 Tax=Acinetobacter venetianus TaxID=52133 RepID=UPI003A8DD44C